MWRLSSVILTLLFSAFLVMALGSVEAGSSLRYTCMLCRLGRVDRTMFGFTRSTYHDNECSRWYAANVEPSHVHLWERGTCRRLLNAFGRGVGFACRSGSYPIWLLPPSTQMEVYQHFPDRQKAKELLANLMEARSGEDRLDETDERRGDLIVQSLSDWVIAGFPGTWENWWARWRERHVAERKEWLTWMHSDSNMNFDDWKASRKTSSPPEQKNPR
ncbi:MAG: hypothetical protein ACP5XB_08450 [Isosphaeraceae bacterium]